MRSKKAIKPLKPLNRVRRAGRLAIILGSRNVRSAQGNGRITPPGTFDMTDMTPVNVWKAKWLKKRFSRTAVATFYLDLSHS